MKKSPLFYFRFLIPALLSALALFEFASAAAGQTAPTLNVAIVGGNLQVSWPANSGNWNLCTRSDLNSGDWSLITTTPVVSNGQNVVTVPKSGAAQYFQLRHQGAVVPFITYEAEAPTNTTTGTVVALLAPPPNATTWSPELEASGRSFVQLNATGQHLDIPVTAAANALVIRHCIPDSLTGGGITATLSVYVNGVFRQKLTLTSTHNWLYGDGKNDSTYNGQSNDPTITGATPHVFWDETRAFLTGTALQPGDVLRFQMDSDDTAAYYRIDLVDLENVPAPLSPPAAGTYLSITDYGATGNDTTDDTTAIQNCITAAKAQGKIVWMPAGTYYQTANFVLNGVTVQGAGMWYTNLISTVTNSSFQGTIGFTLQGSNTHVSDMYVESAAHTTRNTTGGKPFTSSATTNPVSNWSVKNVWITHTNTGFWMSGAKNGTISGCRVRFTYADGINLNLGSSNNVVENNHVRGSGDDGMAILSEYITSPLSAVSTGNVQRFNTIIATWWGHNCDLAGGTGHMVEDNYLADNWGLGCFTINSPGSYQMYPLSNCTVERNVIVRGGGNAFGQKRGAIWIYPNAATSTGITIRDNLIYNSIFRAIHIVGVDNQQITFQTNVINTTGDVGILIESQVVGSGTFIGNTVTNVAHGFAVFTNSSSNYTVTATGNSWQ